MARHNEANQSIIALNTKVRHGIKIVAFEFLVKTTCVHLQQVKLRITSALQFYTKHLCLNQEKSDACCLLCITFYAVIHKKRGSTLVVITLGKLV